MKPLTPGLTLLFAGILATAWQNASATMFMETKPLQEGLFSLASHSCNNHVKDERVDQTGEKPSSEAITPDSDRSSRRKQSGREVYAYNLTDALTGEHCTQYADLSPSRHDWLALTVARESAISVHR